MKDSVSHFQLSTSVLPDISQDEVDFRDSSFFRDHGQLPSPASLLRDHGDRGRQVIKLPELGLVVKINTAQWLRLEEAQTMWAMRRLFPGGEIPVPELFGWRRHGDFVFVYMGLMAGQTLREAWPTFTREDKQAIQQGIRDVISLLHTIPPSPAGIASINGGPVQDRLFYKAINPGPFANIGLFHDWLLATASHQETMDHDAIKGLDIEGTYRDWLPDDGPVYFAHGDLTLTNILVARDEATGIQKIVCVLDWEQAGWYPDYWEYSKMHAGATLNEEWNADEWPEKIVQADERMRKAFFGVAEYTMWLGDP